MYQRVIIIPLGNTFISSAILSKLCHKLRIINRNMKLSTSVGLILLTSVTLSWVASHSLAVKQIEQSSPTSIQKETRSPSVEYSLTFNGQSKGTYSNTLPKPQNYSSVPLLPILEAMGADYQWNQSNDTVSIQDNDNTVKLQVDENFQTRNGYQIPLSSLKDQ